MYFLLKVSMVIFGRNFTWIAFSWRSQDGFFNIWAKDSSRKLAPVAGRPSPDE
jgi:hypothetical protein